MIWTQPGKEPPRRYCTHLNQKIFLRRMGPGYWSGPFGEQLGENVRWRSQIWRKMGHGKRGERAQGKGQFFLLFLFIL